jgi:poly-gamma-glutamate capsule biosynthesis protein CapA/YwtB (metallophosphatase superfamily)
MYGGALFVAVAAIAGVIGAAGIASFADGDATEQASASAPQVKPDKRELARKRRQRVTLSAVGDIVMGTPEGGLPRDGGASLFQSVDGNLKGALVLGNLEGPLADAGTPKCPSAEVAADDADAERADDGDATVEAPAAPTCFAFRTPTSYASHLAIAGFTMMNLANNHALDYGQSGLDSTIAALRAHDIMHTGPKGKISRFRTNGLRIAVVGFAPYEFANSLTDLDSVREITREAGRQADIVIATMHAGAEGADAARVPREPETFLGEQRGDPRAFARAAIVAGADLVIGHGPHVLRGMEVFRNRLIAYSLGNFVGYRSLQTRGALGVGASITVTLHGNGRFVAGRLFPVRLSAQGVPTPGGDAIARVRTLSQQDFGSKRAVAITSNGRITAP